MIGIQVRVSSIRFVKAKLFSSVLLVLVLGFGLVLSGCDNPTGTDDSADGVQDDANTGDDSTADEASPGDILWSTSIGDVPDLGAIGGVVDDVAFDAGRVFAVARTGDDFHAYALDGADGSVLWQYELPGTGTRFGPVIGSNGNVHVIAMGIDDGDGGSLSRVIALDPAEGSVEWYYSVNGNVMAPPAISLTNTLYLTVVLYGEGESNHRLMAIDTPASSATAITPTWTTDQLSGFGLYFTSAGQPSIMSGGTIVLLSGIKLHYIRQTDGHILRSVEYGPVGHSPAIAGDGTIFVGHSASTDTTTFYAIDPTNEEDYAAKWSFPLGSARFSSAAIGSDGTVYVGAQTGRLYAFNPENGDQYWSYQALAPPRRTGVAIADDGTIYFTAGQSLVFAVTADGEEKWWAHLDPNSEIPVSREWTGSPVIGTSGTVYVGSLDGSVYALAGESNGPAPSSWPMRGRGARRAGLF